MPKAKSPFMTISYFGYGSLVNVKTLTPGTDVRPGTLTGWVRQWRISGASAGETGVCSLCVIEQDGAAIRGVLASEPKEGLAKLERRECHYDKVDGIGAAFACDAQSLGGPDDMFLFRAKPEFYRWGDEDSPILQSYIDCVLAGFYDFWGEEGVRHFIETTEGWHVPILSDREAPRYPRAVSVAKDQLQMTDDLLADQRVRYISL